MDTLDRFYLLLVPRGGGGEERRRPRQVGGAGSDLLKIEGGLFEKEVGREGGGAQGPGGVWGGKFPPRRDQGCLAVKLKIGGT